MRQQIQIGDRVVGDGQPLFIIVEVGVTCNYDMDIAKGLIDVTADSGADAVKFMFWFPDEIMNDRSIEDLYETASGTKTENMFEMLSRMRFTLDQWRELKAYADRQNVVMFSTANSPGGIEYAEAIGLEALKLSSWDYNYLPLLKTMVATGKPILLDTGPVDILDVAKVMRLMQDAGNDQSIVLHCFHTENPAEMNMKALPYMRQAFDTLVGFSSSGQSDDCDIMAVALGACVLEKRVTLSRSLPGHHHVLSKEPDEFRNYVAAMRRVHAAVGQGPLRPSEADLAGRRKWFRHLVANQDIPKDTVLDRTMLEGKRGEGISPEYFDLFVGRRTTRDLKRNQSLQWSDI